MIWPFRTRTPAAPAPGVMKHCPACRIVTRPPTAPDQFCHLDGTRLVPTEPGVCACGEPVDLAARYCPLCGAGPR